MARQTRLNIDPDLSGAPRAPLAQLHATDFTFVEEEVAFLDNVFVESVFWFPPDSVINFSAVDRVGENLFLMLQKAQIKINK